MRVHQHEGVQSQVPVVVPADRRWQQDFRIVQEGGFGGAPQNAWRDLHLGLAVPEDAGLDPPAPRCDPGRRADLQHRQGTVPQDEATDWPCHSGCARSRRAAVGFPQRARIRGRNRERVPDVGRHRIGPTVPRREDATPHEQFEELSRLHIAGSHRRAARRGVEESVGGRSRNDCGDGIWHQHADGERHARQPRVVRPVHRDGRQPADDRWIVRHRRSGPDVLLGPIQKPTMRAASDEGGEHRGYSEGLHGRRRGNCRRRHGVCRDVRVGAASVLGRPCTDPQEDLSGPGGGDADGTVVEARDATREFGPHEHGIGRNVGLEKENTIVQSVVQCK
mmetsp:Transcript_24313/g.68337  ORF Transcript_24313/g.68337 Transcript_24313/m.68337 type:complete len:335 (+) Transcript_24313:44-1048(+)